jgi:hypothetical protein
MNMKKVIDADSGEVFNSMTEAAERSGISLPYLSGMLNGKFKNKTKLQWQVNPNSKLR